ncbi:MFS transporter [Microtetraspora sp. NBRC 16547]|uniref:MFS transporter n=1 Tax=Microtetraspora sp. NBRC 16547 TaxID=3030993 RepID=UPI0024A1688D|nr:MFS transporter [Microtetraspora sp. NBRC 16547]GLX02053.1 MFS transporter [Microtetraspora sp. NBRC 16547]
MSASREDGQGAAPGSHRLDLVTAAARLERLPVGAWHWRLTAIVGIGAFYEYFEVFLGGILAAVLTPVWNLGTFEQGWLIGAVFLGMFVGALSLGRMADRLGRKKMFLVNLGIYLVFSLVAAFSPNVWFLVACRFLAGIGAGAEAALIPTYLGEFIPRHRRGRYIGYAFTVAFIAYPVVALAGAPLARSHFLFDGWRWLLVIAASGVVLLLWMRRSMPESPRWLVSIGRSDEAEAELRRIETEVERLHGAPLPEPDHASVPVPTAEKTAEKTGEKLTEQPPGVTQLFRGQNLRRMIAVGSLWTLGVLGYYGFSSLATVLLLDKGYDIQKSLIYTAIIAVGYPLGALTAAWFAERTERRTLVVVSALLTGATGLAFGCATADWVIMLAGFLMGLISNVHSSGVNMYAAEVFPTKLRSTAIGLCYGTGRLFALMMPFLGLSILKTFGGSTVLLLSAVLFTATAVLVFVFGPRTTGRVLEEVAESPAEDAVRPVTPLQPGV